MRSKSIKKTLPKMTILVIVLLLVLILPINMWVQISLQHQNQKANSQETFYQLKQLIQTNEKDIEYGKEEFSKKAIQSAEMAAYFVEHYPRVTSDIKEAKKLAKKLNVDEIHFFDKNGKIYFGTHPEYYNYTFHSGKQMQFFLPMLKDQSLKLCQEITPNTAEGKQMQYAAVWLEDGSSIVQIGFQPRRLIEQIEEKSLKNVLANIPFDVQGYYHIIDKDTKKIIASSSESMIDLDFSQESENEQSLGNAYHYQYNHQRYCCYREDYNQYILLRTYKSFYPIQSIMISTLSIFIYLSIVAIVVIGAMSWYINKKIVNNLMMIVNGLKEIESEKLDELSLQTYVKEYDELIFYINEMINSLRLTWNHFSLILDKVQIPVGIFVESQFYKKVFINDRLLEIFDIHHGELSQNELKELVKEKIQCLKMHMIDKNEHIYEYRGGNTIKYLRLEEMNDHESMTYYMTDVSVWWKELHQLKEISHIDELTSLYNRRGFDDKMTELFNQPQLLKSGMMLMIDADGLKKINDIYGHYVGDEYLKQISQVFNQLFIQNSLCARLGGDEFVIFVYNQSLEKLEAIVEELKSKRGMIFSMEDMDIHETIEFSIGVSFYPEDSTDYHVLMYQADKNMYIDKKMRKTTRE